MGDHNREAGNVATASLPGLELISGKEETVNGRQTDFEKKDTKRFKDNMTHYLAWPYKSSGRHVSGTKDKSEDFESTSTYRIYNKLHG